MTLVSYFDMSNRRTDLTDIQAKLIEHLLRIFGQCNGAGIKARMGGIRLVFGRFNDGYF